MGLLHLFRDRTVAKEEEGVDFRAVLVENAEMNLVGRDGEFIAFRDRAVASAEHAQEARAAFVDDFAADFRGILLAGDAPAQIHIDQMNAPREQLFTQAWEDEAHQVIPFRLHVAEGGRYLDGYEASNPVSV